MALLQVSAFLMGQPYQHAAGVRAGYSWGISYKGFFLHRMSAVEIDVFYNPRGLHVAAQYLIHAEPFRSSRWLAYFGGGIFAGNWEEETGVKEKFSAGIVAVAGMEYAFRDLPLNVGLDWRPHLKVYEPIGYTLPDVGVTIRYRFRL